MNCKEIVQRFLEDNHIDAKKIHLLDDKLATFYTIFDEIDGIAYDVTVIHNILIDLFKLNSEHVKHVSDVFIQKNIVFGRRHKKLLKHYFDYQHAASLDEMIREMNVENPHLDEAFVRLTVGGITQSFAPEQLFLERWNTAVADKDEKKQVDYLFGIYSRVYEYYSEGGMTLVQLFDYNKDIAQSELSSISFAKLEKSCAKSSLAGRDAVEAFYDIYTTLLHEDLQKDSRAGMLEPVMNHTALPSKLPTSNLIHDREFDLAFLETEAYDSIYICFNQDVYNRFGNKQAFYDYSLSVVQEAYRLLVNNKAIAIEIDNIYDNDVNIKWEMYGFLGVYMERFVQSKETRLYFEPHKLCVEMMPFAQIRLKKGITEESLLHLLQSFYKGKENITNITKLLSSSMSQPQLEAWIASWQNVYYGFSFSDCFVVRTPEIDTHSRELSFLQNNNKLLLTFYKYRMDERRLPCPMCSGLTVSGNSYSEVGHRSWECKNIICPSRSKSNRGKRYSSKTTYMQQGAANQNPADLIDKSLLMQWRKDIVDIQDSSELYTMVTKFFSFENEHILFVNTSPSALSTATSLNRQATLISLQSQKKQFTFTDPAPQYHRGIFDSYYSGEYVKRFLIEEPLTPNPTLTTKLTKQMKASDALATIVTGDGFEVMNSLPAESITNAVTSPPYFNAREYSQWSNMYMYLKDMYNMVRATHRLQNNNGGIFLWNIGDVSGNENTIARSNMGTKRLMLGAYSIVLFHFAGYQLVDNVLWDKGEPQSKRNTNDGNFTPHYQKPINAYEHMFLFKKHGSIVKADATKSIWVNNVPYFTPVIKINSKGENLYGHTAPYPEDISDFVVKAFSVTPNDVTLDMFLGSGTTCISGLKEGIRTLGIELDKEYSKLAIRRVSEKGSVTHIA